MGERQHPSQWDAARGARPHQCAHARAVCLIRVPARRQWRPQAPHFATRYSSLATCYLLLASRCSPLATHTHTRYLLLAARCSLLAAHSSLLAARCLLLADFCSLLTTILATFHCSTVGAHTDSDFRGRCLSAALHLDNWREREKPGQVSEIRARCEREKPGRVRER